MIQGGVCVLDEGNRMNEKSWASLAPQLDHRRYIESIVAGVSIEAHPDFRCAVTMNIDESTFEIPDYILSRLQPTLNIQFPSREDEKAILEYHLPFCESEMLSMTVDFLQTAHGLKLDFSPRDGINLLRYATKRMSQETDHPLAKDVAWQEALIQCLGPEAADLQTLAKKRHQSLGGQSLPLGFGDFFFDSNDSLHPGSPESGPYDIDPDDDDFNDEGEPF